MTNMNYKQRKNIKRRYIIGASIIMNNGNSGFAVIDTTTHNRTLNYKMARDACDQFGEANDIKNAIPIAITEIK